MVDESVPRNVFCPDEWYIQHAAAATANNAVQRIDKAIERGDAAEGTSLVSSDELQVTSPSATECHAAELSEHRGAADFMALN